MKDTEATQLAQQVLSIDKSFICVFVISNTGELISGPVHSKPSPFKYPQEIESWREDAFKLAIMIGEAKSVERVFSRVESIAVIREKQQTLLIYLEDRGVILAIFIEKNQNPVEMSKKIRLTLGLV